MPEGKPPEAESESDAKFSTDADDWAEQFYKHLGLAFLNVATGLSPKAGIPDFRQAMIAAAFQTLIESGMSSEEIFESFAQASLEAQKNLSEWTPELNQRRFDLVDKQIQSAISPAERIELAGLTKIMRALTDNESNFPIEGAKALHKKLLDMDDRK